MMQQIPFSPPDITETEINAVVDALRSGWITTGPKVKELEQKISKYCGTDRTVCLSSSTASMELVLRALGVGPGDEVITSAYTYTASCSVICHVGATPVLIDIQKDNLEMDYHKLEEAISEKTKAIIAVDIAGIPCDYQRLHKIVEAKASLFQPTDNPIQSALKRVTIIADAAHSFGAIQNGESAALHADFTTFSFHAVKNFTTAEGGAITWKHISALDDDELYKRFQILSLHGQTKDALHKSQLGAWEYDILEPAYKCNMTDIQAAIGLAQLERYDDMLAKRRRYIEIYEDVLKKHAVLTLKHFDPDADTYSSGHLMVVHLKDTDEATRNLIIQKMAEHGIATNVHYKPLPMLTAYKNLGFTIDDFPNAYNFYKGEISLPLYTKLSEEQVRYVADTFDKILVEQGI